MSLKAVKRKYKIQLALLGISILLTLVISFANVMPKYSIDYIVPTTITVIIILLLYSYILLLKNHIEDLELSFSEQINSQPSLSEDKQKELRPSEIHHRLHGLAEKEKELLRRFLQEDTRTLRLRYDDPTADGLCSIGILEVSSFVSTMRKFSYTLNPIYWDHIKKRPDAIGL
jgi:hypothetical protein